MEWTDEGIVLGVRRHGESSAIVELLTRGHGRHLGLVRGGAGKRMRPLLQPGNSVRRGVAGAARRASRLLRRSRARGCARPPLLASSHAVYGVTHLASLARLLPERDPHRRHLRDARPHAGRFRRHRRGRGSSDQIRAGDAGRTRFRARSGKLRRDRGDHRPRSTSRQSPAARCRGGPASPGATGCCGCRRFCAKARAARTAGRTRTCRTAFGSPGCSCCATCWSRAGRAIPTPATGLSTR